MIERRSARTRGRALWLALALVLILALLSAIFWRGIRITLESWTGENDLIEQIKGTAALALLRVTTCPPDTAPYVPVQHVSMSPMGVNTFLEQEADPAKIDESLRLVSEAGFQWIRQEFPWEDIEISAKGDFADHRWERSAWDKYDAIVDACEQRNIEIIARLDNPPAWSRAIGNAPGWSMAPPDDPNDFGDYVYAVVSRYRGRIRYYQIWNEPNIFPEWGDQPADPAGYVELLQVAYRRAKEADPDCVVIAAGLAQTTEETPWEFGPRNVSDLIYLEEMYKAGAQGHFDVMGAMVYGLWTGPHDQRLSTDRANFSRVQLLREIMVRHGDADKPIWATEIGWNALPTDSEGAPYGRVSTEQQAAYAVQAYQRASEEWPWMGVMNYWFLRRPSEDERDQAWYYFRMLEPSFEPLPVYDAIQAYTAQPQTLGRGFHQEDDAALVYAGHWQARSDDRAVLGGDMLGDQGASVSFTAHGNGLALALRDPQQIAKLTVKVDGRLARAGGTHIVPGTDIQAVRVAGWGRAKSRQVELIVTGDQVALDGIIVYDEPRRWPWAIVLIAILLAFAPAWRRYLGSA